MKRLLLMLLLLPQALGAVDLVSPDEGFLTNSGDLTFEYFPALANVTSCTLALGNQSFQDTTITSNAFNTFSVVNLDEGAYTWRVSCTNVETTEFSVLRNVIIDQTEPSIAILSPAENETVTTPSITIDADDDLSTSLDCTVNANAEYLTTFPVTGTHEEELPLTENGNYVLLVSCLDEAGNADTAQRSITLDIPPPPLYLELTTNKNTYAIGEPVILTVDATPGAAVSVEICPNESGFVECNTPLITGTFPQTLVVPFTNNSGEYLVEGVALLGSQAETTTITYTVTNSLALNIESDREPELDRTITLTAQLSGHIGEATYLWNLSNGSQITGEDVEIIYTTPGTFTEYVKGTDVEGNSITQSFTATITPTHEVTILVRDKETKSPIRDATVHFEREKGIVQEILRTNSDGKALFFLDQERYTLFVSKDGYDYYIDEQKFTRKSEVVIDLQSYDAKAPTLQLNSPEDGVTLRPPVTISYSISDESATTCALLLGKAGEDLTEESSKTGTGTLSFELTALEEETYAYEIHCEDSTGNSAESERRLFTITQGDAQQIVEETAYEINDDALDIIDRAYGSLDAFNAEQRKLATALDWENTLKQLRRTIERGNRDINSLTFRRDLTDEEQREEIAEIEEKILQASKSIPLDIIVHERRSTIEYIKRDALLELAPEIAKQKGYAFTPEQLADYLDQVQKSFTVQTEHVRAKILLSSGKEQPLSLVTHKFQYAFSDEEAESYTIYQAIPTRATQRAEEISAMQDLEILSHRPLALEFAPEEQITYFFQKDVGMGDLAEIKTVLLKRPEGEDLKSISGNVIMTTITKVDWKMSLILMVLLTLTIGGLRRMNAFSHVRSTIAAKQSEKPVSQISSLITDAEQKLQELDMESAMMRYKEAKLTYETLSEYAQHEVYNDLIQLKKNLDEQYFAILVERINTALDTQDLETAIDDFSRLEGTYEHLDPEAQQHLHDIVLNIATKVGLTEEVQ